MFVCKYNNKRMKMKIYCFCIGLSLIILTNTGCNSVYKNTEGLISTHIMMPKSLNKVENYTTVPYTHNKGKPHMVIYYDSNLCQTCQLTKLEIWQPIIDTIQMMNKDVETVFITSPSVNEYNSVVNTISIYNKGYNILIDRFDDFRKSNPLIPDDYRFHTLLLNGNDQVILVGNPLNNDIIWNLYKETISKLNKL